MLEARMYGIPMTMEKVTQDGEDVWLMIGKTWIGDWTMRFLMWFHKYVLGDKGPTITDIKEV
jgi:hypothetical protein